MKELKFENGIATDGMDGNFLLTEEKVEEILIAEGHDISSGDEENTIDSCRVMDLASDIGLKNLGDYGEGCVFFMDYNQVVNGLLEYVQ